MERLQEIRFPVPEILFLFVMAMASTVGAARGQDQQRPVIVEKTWRAADGHRLPFNSDEDVLLFLSEADVLVTEELTGGTNRPLKMKLRRGDVEANAIFRVVDIRSKRAKLDGKLVTDFHDSYIFECAAYEFSRLLGIDNVPPCVKRKYLGKSGTLQLWVEGAVTEKRRRELSQEVPHVRGWLREKQTMRIFDALISNFDRNQGNMITDQDGKLWFIDHTRSFRKSSSIERIDKIVWCSRDLWRNLHLIDKEMLARKLSLYLSRLQINSILKRRDKLVEFLQSRITSIGEESVLYDASIEAVVESVELEELEKDEFPEESSMLVLQD